jgi:DNA primase
MNQPRSINDILDRLTNVKCSGKNKWTSDCPCVGHKTPTGHLSITDTGTKALVTCFNSHSYADICRSLGFDTLSYGSQDKQPHLTEVCAYDYRDFDSTLLYQIVRYIPKTFKVRRPNGAGGWIWNIGPKKVLYHLPDLLIARIHGDSIFVCEGEKDADNCFIFFGTPGTTCPFGARRWLPIYNEVLRGCNVIIIPDNDPVGRAHAAYVCASLNSIVKSLKIWHVPQPYKDVSAWLEAENG